MEMVLLNDNVSLNLFVELFPTFTAVVLIWLFLPHVSFVFTSAMERLKFLVTDNTVTGQRRLLT